MANYKEVELINNKWWTPDMVAQVRGTTAKRVRALTKRGIKLKTILYAKQMFKIFTARNVTTALGTIHGIEVTWRFIYYLTNILSPTKLDENEKLAMRKRFSVLRSESNTPLRQFLMDEFTPYYNRIELGTEGDWLREKFDVFRNIVEVDEKPKNVQSFETWANTDEQLEWVNYVNSQYHRYIHLLPRDKMESMIALVIEETRLKTQYELMVEGKRV